MTQTDATQALDLITSVDPWSWAYFRKVLLSTGSYQLDGHEWQVDIMQCQHKNQCAKKAAQLGFTEMRILTVTHNLIFGRYNQGALYLFPTFNDVTDFSKARFTPLIDNNPVLIGNYVKDTDAANIKRIGTGTLYLRGASATRKIEGIQKSSTGLKSIPVDDITFDEYDEMKMDMVRLALERFSHSEVQSQFKLSTPSIPGFGIDKEFALSNRCYWFLKCQRCGEYTCLEQEFPECITETGLRLCRKCREPGLMLGRGVWVAERPSVTDYVGWHISQLNSKYIDPALILRLWQDPPDGDRGEIERSKLGRAYISAEERLTANDVLACCTNDARERSSKVPTAMGVDVHKRELYVVVGRMVNDERYKIITVKRVPTFNDLHDLAKKYNVESAVLDAEPETHKAREFQAGEPYEVYLCDYAERMKTASRKVDETKGFVVVRRTEHLDWIHRIVVKPGAFEVPRIDSEIKLYSTQMANMAKVLIEDDLGNKVYRYVALDDDHYRHATGYFLLACESPRIRESWVREYMRIRQPLNPGHKATQSYDPLTYGEKQ